MEKEYFPVNHGAIGERVNCPDHPCVGTSPWLKKCITRYYKIFPALLHKAQSGPFGLEFSGRRETIIKPFSSLLTFAIQGQISHGTFWCRLLKRLEICWNDRSKLRFGFSKELDLPSSTWPAPAQTLTTVMVQRLTTRDTPIDAYLQKRMCLRYILLQRMSCLVQHIQIGNEKSTVTLHSKKKTTSLTSLGRKTLDGTT